MTLKSIIALSLLAVTALTSVEASTQTNRRTTTAQKRAPQKQAPQSKTLTQHIREGVTKVATGAIKGATQSASQAVAASALQLENRALLEDATSGMSPQQKKAWINQNLVGKSAAMQNRILKGKIAKNENPRRVSTQRTSQRRVATNNLQQENYRLIDQVTFGRGMTQEERSNWIHQNLYNRNSKPLPLAHQNRVLKNALLADKQNPSPQRTTTRVESDNVCIMPSQIEAAIERKIEERKKNKRGVSHPGGRPGTPHPTTKPGAMPQKQTPQQLAAAKKKEEEMQKAAAKKKKAKEKARIEQGKQENKQACADLIETPINSQRMLTNILGASTKNNCSLSEEGKIFNNACQAFIKGIPLSETTMAENGCTAQARNAGLEVVKTEGGMVVAQKPSVKKEEPKKAEPAKKEAPKVVAFEDMTDAQKTTHCVGLIKKFKNSMLESRDDLSGFRKYWDSDEIQACMDHQPENGKSSKDIFKEKIFTAFSNGDIDIFPGQLGRGAAMKKKFDDAGLTVKEFKPSPRGPALGYVFPDEEESKPTTQTTETKETKTPPAPTGGGGMSAALMRGT